jgi:hypothetical protein
MMTTMFGCFCVPACMGAASGVGDSEGAGIEFVVGLEGERAGVTAKGTGDCFSEEGLHPKGAKKTKANTRIPFQSLKNFITTSDQQPILPFLRMV